MGSCISKFGPKEKKIKKDCCENCSNYVHDKLVIAQQASVSAIPPLIEKPVSHFPSVASNATSTEFSVTSSFSSSSSCSSSISTAKDRSFSSEFLRSCAKKNPHIIGRNSVKGTRENSRIHTNVHGRQPSDKMPTPEKPHFDTVKKTFEERRGGGGGSTPKKRTRANSPTIIRQKSFRKDPEIENSMYNYHRNLRSPSPRRIFNEEQSFKDSIMKTTTMENNYNKRGVISKASMHSAQSLSLKKQSFRASPVSQIHQMKSIKGAYINPQVSSKIDECEDEDENEEKQNQQDEMMVEDMDNPRIALDCFIFL